MNYIIDKIRLFKLIFNSDVRQISNETAFKFSRELPIFSCLYIRPMTGREISEAIDVPFSSISKVFVFYQKYKYVTGKQDMSIKQNPKRYKLTAKGRTKLKKMSQLKTDHPEQWGKPKRD